jgi:hypothetical protein
VQLYDAKTGTLLPTIRLKDTGLVLVRMDDPGPVRFCVVTGQIARLGVRLDGTAVLSVTEPLKPEEKHVFSPAELVFRPNAPPVQSRKDDESQRSDMAFLSDLGIEPAFAPDLSNMPYIGAEGGVINLTLTYLVEDNGQFFENDGDEFTFKLNTGEDFNQAVASNAHRIAFTPGPKDLDVPDLCGNCRLHGGTHEHHH